MQDEMTIQEFVDLLRQRALMVLKGELDPKELVTSEMFMALMGVVRLQRVDLPDFAIKWVLAELEGDGTAERNAVRAAMSGEVFGSRVALFDANEQLLHGRQLKARRAILAAIIQAGQVYSLFPEDAPEALSFLVETVAIEFSELIGPNIFSWLASQGDLLEDDASTALIEAWAKSKSLKVSPDDWEDALERI